jgi:hypothetical protein
MARLLPGVALRSTPGYHISPLRGLGTTGRHSSKSQEWTSAYAKVTKARERRISPFPSFPRRRETRNTGSQEEANKGGPFLDLSSLAYFASWRWKWFDEAKNIHREEAIYKSRFLVFLGALGGKNGFTMQRTFTAKTLSSLRSIIQVWLT